MPKLIINGIRGIPAAHGGFETFAEYLAKYLVKNGWKVTVYCQGTAKESFGYKEWEGIELITIPEKNEGALGTVIFDLKTVIHSLRAKSLVLTLGYNTALFNIIYRIFRIPNIINMDGIEWKRDKWGTVAKTWFWLNERFGCWFGNHLVADHPQIAAHLATRVSNKKITTIAYGGLEVTDADVGFVNKHGLVPKEYGIVIARPEPENSILEIIQGFSCKQRNNKLVILGNYDFDNNPYHKKIKEAASEEVIFLGAIYDIAEVSALRFYASCYVHGHTVGGTNPSLVESIGAGNAIIAHDNKFNKWVAKDGALYFESNLDIDNCFTQVFDNDTLRLELEGKTKANFQSHFRWDDILNEYLSLLTKYSL
jgi:glycosyltransferase involved in cell wall biosynthesis